jgi:type VI protein secretion system component Hcp
VRDSNGAPQPNNPGTLYVGWIEVFKPTDSVSDVQLLRAMAGGTGILRGCLLNYHTVAGKIVPKAALGFEQVAIQSLTVSGNAGNSSQYETISLSAARLSLITWNSAGAATASCVTEYGGTCGNTLLGCPGQF